MLAGSIHGAVYVQGDEFTVFWFGDEAHLVAISRVALPRIRVTESERRDEARRRKEELALRSQIRVDPGQRPPAYAAHLPQVTRLTVDLQGRAWLRRWTRYGSDTAEWIVLERYGAPIARITMPAALQPNDIGTDYILGISTNEDGVQSVQKYRIVR
jgi:hypothetical protein